MTLAPGARLGRYEVAALIGRGGMGEVYRARDTRLQRNVAVKVLADRLASASGGTARFEREILTVAALSHPNILAIHDFGVEDGRLYAVTELLEGQPLREALAGERLPLDQTLAYAIQIARGLQAAHNRGIVHRDLKPENVFVLEGGHVKILDFGLARAVEPASDPSAQPEAAPTLPALTGAGLVLGTAGYMAPEQIRGGTVDHRADIFAFGCVLYEMLAGTRAFQGDSYVETSHAALHGTPQRLRSLGVPDGFAAIAERCLAKQPGDRFQTAADLAFALEAIGPVARGTAGQHSSTPAVEAASDRPTGIAVLPFESLGGEDQEHFAAGITEEVTLQLAKVRALRVMSRNAVARFANGAQALPAMSKELSVSVALTGTVRRSGAQVRVGVQLLAAPNGETLWAEQYDRTLSNIFDVQSDIALRVASALRTTLPSEERAQIERPPTSNAAAYELFLKQSGLSSVKALQNDHGIALLQDALALDPAFALAHAVLARRLRFRGYETGRIDTLRALEAARTSVALDPGVARGHYALASALAALGRPDEARLAMQRAIELDGNMWEAMTDLSLLEQEVGRLDQAFYWAERGWPIAPNVAVSYYHLSMPLVVLDDGLAERLLLAASTRVDLGSVGSLRLALMLAVIDFRRGQLDSAVQRLRASAQEHPDATEPRVLLMEMAAYASTPDAAALVDSAVKRGAAARLWWGPYTPRTLRAFLWLRDGDIQRARPLMDAAWAANRAAVDAGDRGMAPVYESAALHLMEGDRAAALSDLERSFDLGNRDSRFLLHDPLVASVSSEPRFAALLRRIDDNLAEMRQRCDFSDVERWIASGALPQRASR